MSAALSQVASAGTTQIKEFGVVIDKPGHFVLTKNIVVQPEDLDPGNKVAAITILADGVKLNLGGHSITGEGGFERESIGILIDGASNVYIKDGTITMMSDSGITLNGATDCRIKGVDVVFNHDGILSTAGTDITIEKNNLSDNEGYGVRTFSGFRDKLIKNSVSNNLASGLRLVGDQVEVRSNKIIGSRRFNGVQLFGDDGIIEGNTLLENRQLGIWVALGSGFVVANNVVIVTEDPADFGFFKAGIVSGFGPLGDMDVSDTVIAGNTVLGHTGLDPDNPFHVDVFDTSIYWGHPCQNVWLDNDFESDNETGGDFGPGVGCVQ